MKQQSRQSDRLQSAVNAGGLAPACLYARQGSRWPIRRQEDRGSERYRPQLSSEKMRRHRPDPCSGIFSSCRLYCQVAHIKGDASRETQMQFPGGPAGTRPKSHSPEALRPWLSPGLPLPVFALAGTPCWLRSHVADITAVACQTIIEALVRDVNVSLIKRLIHGNLGSKISDKAGICRLQRQTRAWLQPGKRRPIHCLRVSSTCVRPGSASLNSSW